MDCLTEDARRETPWDILFANDVVLSTNNREKAETMLDEWPRSLADRGMTVSRNETDYLCTRCGDKLVGNM